MTARMTAMDEETSENVTSQNGGQGPTDVEDDVVQAADDQAADTDGAEGSADEIAEDTAADDETTDSDEESDSGDETDESADDSADVESEEPVAEEDVDPVEEMRAALRRAPGDWYVVHSYAGYENKVKANLETRVQTLDVEEFIFQVEVPTEEVTEIKNGQRKQVQRKVLPGYILVRMELNDQSWGAVRNTPGVTGFVGATNKPSPLSHDDVIKFLLPKVEPEGSRRRLQGRCGRRQPGQARRRGRLRGRRVGHRHGRPVRHAPGDDQRGQRRRPEGQGARVHLRPRDTRRAGVQPGLEDLRTSAAARQVRGEL